MIETALDIIDFILISGLAIPGVARAQDGAAPRCSDASAIDWFLPDQFEQALARARTEQRLLVIKGISFGVDQVGAQCATKGQW